MWLTYVKANRFLVCRHEVLMYVFDVIDNVSLITSFLECCIFSRVHID